MVLVDTPVWIHYLFGRPQFVAELDGLLAAEQVFGHELVFGELLIGDRGGRTAVLARYQKFRHAVQVPHREVVAFVRDRRLHGRGVGWIDINLLASAIAERSQLWTADHNLATLAREFGVAYDPKKKGAALERRFSH